MEKFEILLETIKTDMIVLSLISASVLNNSYGR